MTISPEEAMNRVLLGLNTTPAPAGMEARIAARLLQMTETHAAPARSRSSWWLTSAETAGIIIAIAAASLVLHHHPTGKLALQPRQNLQDPRLTKTPSATAQVRFVPKARPETASTDTSPSTAETATDYDAIALAETLAPSQPAANLPLTAQETALAQAMRPGAPVELAELDVARQPVLRAAAEERDRTNLRRYASGLLATLAAFDTAEPEPRNSSPAETPPVLQQPTTSR